MPAGDIAENPYWKRDTRRSYPQLSVVNQSDAVALLSIGSAAAPKQELIGEAGSKALVEAKEQGLAAFFGKGKEGMAGVLDANGLPPLPSGFPMQKGRERYEMTEEQAYPAQ